MIDLSDRLASGDTLYGTFLGLGSALAAEACALAGFDWLLTDLERRGRSRGHVPRDRVGGPGHAGHAAPSLPPGRGPRRRHLQPRLRVRPAPGTARHCERARPGRRADREQARRGTGRGDRKGARYPRPVHRPVSERNTVVRSLHDLGLAAWFGGSLAGAVGFNGAAADVPDEKLRLTVANAAWARWTPVNLAAIAAHLVGGLGIVYANRGRISAQQGVGASTGAKAALTGAALAVTGYSRILGKKLEQAEGEPVAGGTDPSPVTLLSPPSSRWPSHSRAGPRSALAGGARGGPVGERFLGRGCGWQLPYRRGPWARRPRHRVGVAITGPRPTTQRVCAARSSALSQVRNAVSAPVRPHRAQMPPACSTTASR